MSLSFSGLDRWISSGSGRVHSAVSARTKPQTGSLVRRFNPIRMLLKLVLRSLSAPRAMSISYAEAAALRKAAQKSARPRVSRLRSSAPELPQHHPQVRSQPEPLSFQSVARPGAYYERPRIKRDLPSVSVSSYSCFASAS